MNNLLFGQITIQNFLNQYWQKKPLIIKQALPNSINLISPEELAGLSLEENIESRLIRKTENDEKWSLKNGPFNEQTFNELPENNWTLLVQAVNHWSPQIAKLLDNFKFIPNWRLDDIMVSYATQGGSVGPHFDFYDVFLIQGSGARKWKIGQLCDNKTPLLENNQLQILKEFRSTQEHILTPGDILYIPPRLAHWGISQDNDCITYSVGFRAPSHSEILTRFSEERILYLNEENRFQDSATKDATINPGEISIDVIKNIIQIIEKNIGTPESVAEWFGKLITEPKHSEFSDSIDIYPDINNLIQTLLNIEPQRIIYKSQSSRFCYFSSDPLMLFIDGECFQASLDFAKLLCEKNDFEVPLILTWIQSKSNQKLIHFLFNQQILYFEEEIYFNE